MDKLHMLYLERRIHTQREEIKKLHGIIEAARKSEDWLAVQLYQWRNEALKLRAFQAIVEGRNHECQQLPSSKGTLEEREDSTGESDTSSET